MHLHIQLDDNFAARLAARLATANATLAPGARPYKMTDIARMILATELAKDAPPPPPAAPAGEDDDPVSTEPG